VVFGEGEQAKVIRAAYLLETQGIAKPILLGRPERIAQAIAEMNLEYAPEVVNPNDSEPRRTYAEAFTNKRQRKGMNLNVASNTMRQSSYFGPMMVEMGEADAFISGLTQNYPEVLRPALQVVGTQEDRGLVSGVNVIIANDRVYFFTDPTVNIEPTVDELATIAINAADVARQFDVEPRIAMLSFSSFGSTRHPLSEQVRTATEKVKALRPDLTVDGEVQADVAVVAEMMDDAYPFSQVRQANVLVFPDLTSANTSYKLMARLGDAESIGPILVGMGKPIHVLEQGCEVRDIVNGAILAVVDVQYRASLQR
jgi:malate dehydrogenase (oxaloacetate-decarboxylating)(NADP+)